MQSDPNFYSDFEVDGYRPSAAMDDYYSCGVPAASSNSVPAGGMNGYMGPSDVVELQPSNTCPKNFLIFDQAEHKNRVMFHPSLAQQYSCQHYGFGAVNSQYHARYHGEQTDNQVSSPKEDVADIDALLSLEEDEEDAEDDDVVSTGRTPGHAGSSSSNSAAGARKKEKMKKMVKALKGIVPGGDQMDTPAVLDEAVRYLKSLKVQVEKLGIRDLKN